MILFGNGLRSTLFFYCERIVGAALNRGVVYKDHAFQTGDAANTGNDSGARHIVCIDFVGGELGQLQKWRARIQ